MLCIAIPICSMALRDCIPVATRSLGSYGLTVFFGEILQLEPLRGLYINHPLNIYQLLTLIQPPPPPTQSIPTTYKGTIVSMEDNGIDWVGGGGGCKDLEI